MSALFPRFTNRRRILQIGWYAIRRGFKVFDKLNKTNIFLAKQFSNHSIECNVCGQTAAVWYEMLSVRQRKEHKVGLLRETLECLNCLSRMRYRIMACGILRECKDTHNIDINSIQEGAEKIGNISILDTDSFSPISRILSRGSGYKMSIFMPNLPLGSIVSNNVYNIDLQNITFPDESFDIILSSDVMEHVRNFDLANKEIYRCLKPGGAHIFTVPFDDASAFTRELIDSKSSKDLYLDLPQIHGDDHLTGGIPAYRIYGMDIIEKLNNIGFDASILKIDDSKSGIYGGVYFIARRPGLFAGDPLRNSSNPGGDS